MPSSRRGHFHGSSRNEEERAECPILFYEPSGRYAMAEKGKAPDQESLDQAKKFPKLLRSPRRPWMLTERRERPWRGQGIE